MGNILDTLRRIPDCIIVREKETGSNNNIAEAMRYCCPILPGDVISDILARLPIKFLLRLKCVCKTWHNLLTSPYFTTMHLNRTTTDKNISLFLHFYHPAAEKHAFYSFFNDAFTPLRIPITFSSCSVHIVGSSNGILCIAFYGCFDPPFVVWNPATREVRYLPPPPTTPNHHFASSYGFSFIPRICDFKMVRLNFIPGSSNATTGIEVFTLSNNSWREIRTIVPCEIQNFVTVLVNGSLHWMAIGVDDELNKRDFVVSFDMDEEIFRQKQVPCSFNFNRDRITMSLSVLKKSLAMFVFPKYSDIFLETCFDVWVMNDYGGATEYWSKQFTIGPLPWLGKPIGFWSKGEVIFDQNGTKKFLYDPHKKAIRQIPSHEGWQFCGFFPYVESFASVKWRK